MILAAHLATHIGRAARPGKHHRVARRAEVRGDTLEIGKGRRHRMGPAGREMPIGHRTRSEEHTSELQSLMRISYAVFCLKKNKRHDQSTIKYHKQLSK